MGIRERYIYHCYKNHTLLFKSFSSIFKEKGNFVEKISIILIKRKEKKSLFDRMLKGPNDILLNE